MEGLERLAAALGVELGRAARADRADRPRHDGCDQRAARAQGRARRPADHRGSPRRSRDAGRPEGRPLRPPPAAAGAAGAAPPPPGRARAAARRRPGRDAVGRGLAGLRRSPSWRRRGRGGGDLLPPCLSRWPPRAGDGGGGAHGLPEAYLSLSSEVFPQIKEYERVCTTVVNAYVGPALERYLGRLAMRLIEAGYRGPGADHPVPRRGGDARGRRAPRRRRRALRPRRRGRRQPPCRAPGRPPRPDPLRHGGHQHRHLAGGGRRGPDRLRPPARRPAGRAAGARHRQHRGRRRLDRAGRCRRRAARRAGERRRRAWARLLWPGRHARRR